MPLVLRPWFIALVLAAMVLAVALIVNLQPTTQSTPAANLPTASTAPQVVGGNAESTLEDLPLGTAIAYKDVHITVDSVEPGPLTEQGAQAFSVTVTVENRSGSTLNLGSLLWMTESTTGIKANVYDGFAADGSSLSSEFASSTLENNSSFTGKLYFALAQPVGSETTNLIESVIFLPTTQAYNNDDKVVWLVSKES